MTNLRLQTGVPGLDERLGGGLMPGTLTAVVGATGVGKTQFGLQFLYAGKRQEGRPGIVFDMQARGDSQNHTEYADRLFGWSMQVADGERCAELSQFFDPDRRHGEYLHVFDYAGRRVTRNDLDWDQWRHWQSQLNTRLRSAIAFLYGNFVSGIRRVVVDGVEPVDQPHDSIQLQLFEYVYHQVLRKDPEWVARDLFRETYRQHAAAAAAHPYAPAEIGCMLLSTSREVMLDDLISRQLDEGDAFVNANTLILLGKIRDGSRMGRAMYIAKHRGSACSDEIIPFSINDQGLVLAATSS